VIIALFDTLSALADTSGTVKPAQSIVAPGTLQLIATVAAAVAALSAWRSTANALRFKKADKQERYYERIVASPIMAALEELKKIALPLIGPAIIEIGKLCSDDASQTAVRTRVKKLTEEVQASLQGLKDAVATTIAAWFDERCNTALWTELERLEDALVIEAEKLAMDQTKPDMRKVLLDGVAHFHVTLIENDLSLRTLGGVLPKRKAGKA
jgi:NAD-dependent DNA ligase